MRYIVAFTAALVASASAQICYEGDSYCDGQFIVVCKDGEWVETNCGGGPTSQPFVGGACSSVAPHSATCVPVGTPPAPTTTPISTTISGPVYTTTTPVTTTTTPSVTPTPGCKSGASYCDANNNLEVCGSDGKYTMSQCAGPISGHPVVGVTCASLNPTSATCGAVVLHTTTSSYSSSSTTTTVPKSSTTPPTTTYGNTTPPPVTSTTTSSSAGYTTTSSSSAGYTTTSAPPATSSIHVGSAYKVSNGVFGVLAGIAAAAVIL